MTDQLIKAIIDAAEWCDSIGLKSPIPTRDKREPGRKRKMAADLRLAAIIRRMWRRQSERIQRKLEMQTPAQKVLIRDIDFDLQDDEALEELVMEIILAARDGISLFGDNINLTMDYTATNTEAAEWARKYAYEFVKDIDKQTVDSLRQAISTFVETPGFTIGDVMDLLPFDTDRAQRVAVTEITRAYAQGQQMAGEQLAKEYPDVKTIKHWHTNQDDRVCELCAPLDGKEVGIDENFYEPENQYQDGNPPIHPGDRCWFSVYTVME